MPYFGLFILCFFVKFVSCVGDYVTKIRRNANNANNSENK